MPRGAEAPGLAGSGVVQHGDRGVLGEPILEGIFGQVACQSANVGLRLPVLLPHWASLIQSLSALSQLCLHASWRGLLYCASPLREFSFLLHRCRAHGRVDSHIII